MNQKYCHILVFPWKQKPRRCGGCRMWKEERELGWEKGRSSPKAMSQRLIQTSEDIWSVCCLLELPHICYKRDPFTLPLIAASLTSWGELGLEWGNTLQLIHILRSCLVEDVWWESSPQPGTKSSLRGRSGHCLPKLFDRHLIYENVLNITNYHYNTERDFI